MRIFEFEDQGSKLWGLDTASTDVVWYWMSLLGILGLHWRLTYTLIKPLKRVCSPRLVGSCLIWRVENGKRV
jgi:hypothetical protein